MIHELHRQGVSVSAIARQVGLDRETVHKYIERGLAVDVWPAPSRASKIALFTRYLHERLAALPPLTGRHLHRSRIVAIRADLVAELRGYAAERQRLVRGRRRAIQGRSLFRLDASPLSVASCDPPVVAATRHQVR